MKKILILSIALVSGMVAFAQEETMNNYDKDSKYQRLYSYLTIGADVLIKPAHLRLRGAVDFGMWDRYSSVKEITTKDGPNFRLGIAYLF